MKGGFVYILTNKNNTVLYIGVTADLFRRMQYHRIGEGSLFCKRYNVKKLVYYEFHSTIMAAIRREKQLKEWKRAWKLELIFKKNPEMKDLYGELSSGRTRRKPGHPGVNPVTNPVPS